MNMDSSALKLEQMDEKNWALECAARILKRKHAAGSRHMKHLLLLESVVEDLREKLEQKGRVIREITDSSWEIVPMERGRGPETIPAKVSIIIPVKNPGEQLGHLLNKIRAQKKVPDIEVIILDSGSSDGSIDLARESGETVVQVPPAEFNHGATRNLGAGMAKGEFLVFTVQDAMPSSDYWLYRMVSPFMAHPRLAALSARQIVKPEADLFSLWSADGLSRLLNFPVDVIYRHAPGYEVIGLDHLDNSTKRRLTFFDNVSSCVRADIFREMQFAPLMNAEDIDFGVRLFSGNMETGYLTSAGVYHWHDRGADHVLRRHYIGVKSNYYTLNNELEYFFKHNDIGWEKVLDCISGSFELISAAVIAPGNNGSARPITRVESFVQAMKRYLDEPDMISSSQPPAEIGAGTLAQLITQLAADRPSDGNGKYDFKKNFLIPDFMARFNDFAKYLCGSQPTLEGREKDFSDTIFKIFAQSVGDYLGTYYIEEETIGRLTPELKELDHSLGKGICY
ncbi:MAG TPA: glycosyltransferase family A protein [Geobacteraceae bacterium]